MAKEVFESIEQKRSHQKLSRTIKSTREYQHSTNAKYGCWLNDHHFSRPAVNLSLAQHCTNAVGYHLCLIKLVGAILTDQTCGLRMDWQ